MRISINLFVRPLHARTKLYRSVIQYKVYILMLDIVQWILTKTCFAVWTMFYDWFWYYGMFWAGISRVPLWHPWADFFKGKNKMAAKYFKVKYDFSTNEARNKSNTSFSCDFDWAIHFLYYFLWLEVIFKVKKSISRSNRQTYHF